MIKKESTRPEEKLEINTIQGNLEASADQVQTEEKSEQKESENKFLVKPEKRLPELEELLKAGVHFGHQKGRWNPQAKSFIYDERNGVHIIDLQITLKRLEETLGKIKEIISGGGTILFVGTKKQVREIVEEAAKTTNMPYVIERWLGGTFTNFSTISRRIQKLLDIELREKEGRLGQYTKKERMRYHKEIEDFEKNMGGIKTLKKLPEAIFVVGAKEEKTALKEAKNTGVATMAILDTNTEPDDIDYPIPGNDDAVRSVQLILSYIVREIQEAKQK